jgi:hypothetical protein
MMLHAYGLCVLYRVLCDLLPCLTCPRKDYVTGGRPPHALVSSPCSCTACCGASVYICCTSQVGEQMKRMPGGSGSNPFAQMVEDADGLDKIEALQVRVVACCLVYIS